MSTPRTYINGTCQVGQREACGQPATYAIAVMAVADVAWDSETREGGIVLLCAEHAETPIDHWHHLATATPADPHHRSTRDLPDVLDGTGVTANTWQSAARRLADRVREAEANASEGWVEAMSQQQRVEKALVLAADWEREATCLGRSLSELMLRDAAKRLRAALTPDPGKSA